LFLACGELLFSVYEFSIMGTSGKRWELVAGIAVIAALAVTFAILPMPVAIALSGLTGCLVLLWLDPISNPYKTPGHRGPGRPAPRQQPFVRAEPIFWLFCLFGFLCGAFFGVRSVSEEECGLPAIAVGFWSGVVGAIVAGIVCHFVAWGLSVQRSYSHDLAVVQNEKRWAEIESTEQLMAQAEARGEEDVRVKLAEYKARLEDELWR
jgi:hypothetical protein